MTTSTNSDPRTGRPVRIAGTAFPDGCHRYGFVAARQTLPGVTRVAMAAGSDIEGTFPFASRSLRPVDFILTSPYTAPAGGTIGGEVVR